MDNAQRKEYIDMKLSKLISAIRDNRKASCNNKFWSQNLIEDDAFKHSPQYKFTSNYEHRFLAQKEIIKCQKGTISMQEKMIEQMQNEIQRQKNELAYLKNNETGKKPISKFKAAPAHPADAKVDSIEKTNSRNSTPAKFPDVLKGMNQRHEERRQRWNVIKEQKALKEKQRIEEAAQKQLENKKLIAEQKRQKFKAVARRMREIEEQKKHDKLLKEWALKFYDKFSLMIYFAIWWIESRETKARLLTATYAYTQQMQCYDESAIRIYEKELMASAFRRWHIYCLKSQIAQEEKYQAARAIYLRSMYKHYFQMWRELPKLNYEKIEQEKRIRDWESSVQKIIPDFQIQE
ncbi:coiled-coil domain-containing protein 191 isoform X2 [Cimex lectularius]|uniref:Coiled-coil domain-containing protein n=1 Tax=Cimex lectularius TaxID=79782 RepID=A0A8I6RF11_CIMLE|nr:coiled-coil domain-containing protein 191 isoform X2 [Cimex lectularius]